LRSIVHSSIKKTWLGLVAGVALFGAIPYFAGCSALVKADRSKVPDDLYQPTPGTGGSEGATGGAGGSVVDAAGGDARDAAAREAGTDGSSTSDGSEAGASDALDALSPADATPG
jgi:hypothetical protein